MRNPFKSAPADPTVPAEPKRWKQFVETYKMTRRSDPAIGLWILGSFLLGALVGFGIFYFIPGSGVFRWVMLVLTAVMLGVLAALIVFGRRAQRAMYTQMEGTLGAGAGALQLLNKSWKVQPAVGVNRHQDMVHRVVGRPGVVLVGEGSNSGRVRQLLATERKRHERVLIEVPVHEVLVGSGEGEVPVPKLVKAVQDFPRAIEPAEMTVILRKLTAIDNVRGAVPMPKGPVPTSMKGARRGMRGR